MANLRLYHGSNKEISSPRLLPVQRALDFGKGFYTTTDFEQAEKWARRTSRIREKGGPLISCYELDENAIANLKCLRFLEPDKKWLDYVSANRKDRNAKDDYDIVIGPVANDQTFPTILLYLDGYIDAESAVKQLIPQKLKDQYVFKTQEALAHLKFIEARQA